MRAADLDDVVEGGGLGGERILQMLERRQQTAMDLLGRRDVHGGREGVVRRLAAIDMVVGVHERFLPTLAAEELGRAIGDHLVGVHVRLGAGAGLPDHQREMVVEGAGHDLVGSRHDRIGELAVQRTIALVHLRRRTLHDAERAHQGQRHALAADLEVLQAALGLRAPIARRVDLDRPERIRLDPYLARHQASPHFAGRAARAGCDVDCQLSIGRDAAFAQRTIRNVPTAARCSANGFASVLSAETVECRHGALASGYFLRNRSRVTISAPSPPAAGSVPDFIAVDGPRLGAGLGGQRQRGRLGSFAIRLVAERELQTELDAGIGKDPQGRERDDETLGLVIEAQRHTERIVADVQVPELVLQDDGHLRRVSAVQVFWNLDTGMVGLEGDVEMVRRRDLAGSELPQHVTHHRAQGRLNQLAVVDLLPPHVAFVTFGALGMCHG